MGTDAVPTAGMSGSEGAAAGDAVEHARAFERQDSEPGQGSGDGLSDGIAVSGGITVEVVLVRRAGFVGQVD